MVLQSRQDTAVSSIQLILSTGVKKGGKEKRNKDAWGKGTNEEANTIIKTQE